MWMASTLLSSILTTTHPFLWISYIWPSTEPIVRTSTPWIPRPSKAQQSILIFTIMPPKKQSTSPSSQENLLHMLKPTQWKWSMKWTIYSKLDYCPFKLVEKKNISYSPIQEQSTASHKIPSPTTQILPTLVYKCPPPPQYKLVRPCTGISSLLTVRSVYLTFRWQLFAGTVFLRF